jgi:hypothetical protein
VAAQLMTSRVVLGSILLVDSLLWHVGTREPPELLATDPEVPGLIPGATIFSDT